MEKQYLKGLVEKVETDGVLQVAVASDETVDREGESVKADGWDLSSFKKNPVFLWSHNAGYGEQRPPIGKVKNIKQEGKKLLFTPVFDMQDSFAAEIFRKFKDGFLNAFSVGFIPLERDVKDSSKITSAELLEISAVNVPANPRALVALREAGIPVSKSWTDWKEGKGPVGTHTTARADIGTAWDGASARRSLLTWAGGRENTNFSKYKRGFAWFDGDNADTLGAYKLPHHTVSDGELVVVFRGVVAAMGALLGARGGTDIPEGDRRAVYNHLSAHYRQFDREPPEFRMVETQILKDFDVTVHDIVIIEKTIIKKEKPKKTVTTEKVFGDEDMIDALRIIAKASELAIKKAKNLKGGETKK